MDMRKILFIIILAQIFNFAFGQDFTLRYERKVFDWHSNKKKKGKDSKYKIVANDIQIFDDFLEYEPKYFPNRNDNTCQYLLLYNSNDQFAIINSKGEFIIPFSNGYINNEISEKYKLYNIAIIVKKENNEYFSYAIDSSFKEIENSVSTDYSPLKGTSDNYTYLIQDPKTKLYGLFNFQEKKVIIPKQYKTIEKLKVTEYANVFVLTDTLNKVSFCNKNFINSQVQNVDKYIPTEYEYNDIVVFQKNNLFGFFNTKSNKVTKEQFNYMQADFTGSYTLVGIPKEKKQAYMKNNGEIVTKFEYDKYEYSPILGFSDICDSCILTKKNNLYGVVQENGKILFPNKYKSIYRFEALGNEKNSGYRRYGVFMVFSTQNNKGALFDLNGFPITDFLYEDFKHEDSYIIGKIGNTKHAFYDWNGEQVDYNYAQKSTTNNLVKETNRYLSDFFEKKNVFVTKWEEVVNNTRSENLEKLKLFQKLIDNYKEELIRLNNKILANSKIILNNYTKYISDISKERVENNYKISERYLEMLNKLTPQYMLNFKWVNPEKENEKK